jgi:hypothetical protein
LHAIRHGGKIEKKKPLEFEKIVHLRKKMLKLPSRHHGRRDFSTKAQHQSSFSTFPVCRPNHTSYTSLDQNKLSPKSA